jgi:hypothetical protein
LGTDPSLRMHLLFDAVHNDKAALVCLARAKKGAGGERRRGMGRYCETVELMAESNE